MNEAFIAGFLKTAGGPGSGVAGYNTRHINLPLSKHVSVGTRKALIENAPYEERVIPMSEIEAVCQRRYVPKKVARMERDFDKMKDKPIDVLQVHDGKYHVVDGHHRYLMHAVKGSKEIRARVFKRRADA